MAKNIYISPSDQTSNKYAYGNTNEAVVCRKIADATEAALKRCGFNVKNNKTSSMAARVVESDKWGADLHLPIHTNAFNKKVTGTRLFCWDKTGEGYKACRAIFNKLAPLTPGTSESISVNTSLYEIRNPSAPTAYVEVDFHDVADIAKWLIENVEAIGEAICQGVCDYFGVAYVPKELPEKKQLVLGEYDTLREADDVLGEIHATIASLEAALDDAKTYAGKLEAALKNVKVVG